MTLIPVQELLAKIGFKRKIVPGANSKNDVSEFIYDFGNFVLNVQEGMNNRLADVFNFMGVNKYKNTLSAIEFELPLAVESYEQGVAFISFGLGKDFAAQNVPAWYHQGLFWKSHLPWEKSKLAYSQKPSATIEYDYFKLIVQKMRKKSAEAIEEDITTLSFDGNTLTINCLGERIIAPATGNPWEEVLLKTRSLDHLPRRIKHQNGTIYIWENRLYVANYVLPLLTEISA